MIFLPGTKKYVGLHVLKKIIHQNIHLLQKPNIYRLNQEFTHVCFYDSNTGSHNSSPVRYKALLAIGKEQELIVHSPGTASDKLESFRNTYKNWMFGHLSYELKNETEPNLNSKNPNHMEFPVLHFFIPELVIEINNKEHILYFDDEYISEEAATIIYQKAFASETSVSTTLPRIEIKNRITKEQYIHSFNSLKNHILRGDIYEINFCQEFYANKSSIDPSIVYKKLNLLSEAPFSAFCKFDKHYILSSSPERFLLKQGNHLISQPIKGTIKRSANPTEDFSLKEKLRYDLKEQNENVMIVDLVRNDLSRIAKKGSVNVDELFGIYSFKQVHQMISTVSCELKDNTSFKDILMATFPMGSMTGAPKVNAMKLIDKYESHARGLYSGAIGYFSPDGDFDFSVVIRSILYNADSGYLSFMTGSAITSGAEAEAEYEECLLKAKAMFAALN